MSNHLSLQRLNDTTTGTRRTYTVAHKRQPGRSLFQAAAADYRLRVHDTDLVEIGLLQLTAGRSTTRDNRTVATRVERRCSPDFPVEFSRVCHGEFPPVALAAGPLADLQCLKNIPDVFSYKSRKHCQIFIIFSRNITKKASNQKMLYFSTSPN